MLESQLCLWAKLGQETWPEKYHPLICHLIDVAAVAGEIWDRVLRNPLKERFAAALGLPIEVCGTWVAYLVGAHDIGKACPGFQIRDERTRALATRLIAAGFDLPGLKAPPHATVSVPVLMSWLERRGFARKLATRLAVSVGGHHGFFPIPQQRGYELTRLVLGNDRWDQSRIALLDSLAELVDLPKDGTAMGGTGADQSYLMLLAGLTTAADWVGSRPEFFPGLGDKSSSNLDPAAAERFIHDYSADASDRARVALEELGWRERLAADGRVRTFAELFPLIIKPRPLQVAAESVAKTLERPSLVLVEAPMGEGKTEAAQLLADAWDRRGGQGFYFALPTMATSNGMFKRVVAFLKHREDCGDRPNLHLLHGQSLLSPLYKKLQNAASSRTIVQDVYDEEAGEGGGRVVADAWFAEDKKQAMLAPYAVGTIDQALLSVLQTKHGFLRLFGLAGKTVVLDEVHAYDAYTSVLMAHLVKWLAALGCPVVLLSATLPKAKRRELLEAYAGPGIAIPDATYPCLTVIRSGGSAAEATPLSVSETSTKIVHLEWHSETALATELANALTDGGCAAVIRNTVTAAQSTYLAIKPVLEAQGIGVELFHARFLMKHRQEIEQRVLSRYGQKREDWPADRKARVLVATQVVEQSLDLDFDLLVTDVAPVDLVLQRLGRLQRHDRPDRPLNRGRPTAWLIEPDIGAGPPNFGTSELIYARFVLLRSYLALKGNTGNRIALPGDVEQLVESVYGDSPAVEHDDPAWATSLQDADRQLRAELKEDRIAAGQFLVTEPTDDDDILSRFSQRLEEDNPDVPKSRQAFTRLAEPTVQLVMVYEIGGRLWLDADAKVRAPLHRQPTLKDAEAILGNSVTIGHKGCVFHYRGVDPPEKWLKSGLLRFHRLVKVDASGVVLAGEFPLRVDGKQGVVWLRPEKREVI